MSLRETLDRLRGRIESPQLDFDTSIRHANRCRYEAIELLTRAEAEIKKFESWMRQADNDRAKAVAEAESGR